MTTRAAARTSATDLPAPGETHEGRQQEPGHRRADVADAENAECGALLACGSKRETQATPTTERSAREAYAKGGCDQLWVRI